MAVYIVVAVLFGLLIGFLYANAKNEEQMIEKEQKLNKIVSDKNAMIMHLKSELRAAYRKVDTINQGYELQSKLLSSKEKEFNKTTKHKSMSLQIDRKDKIIELLEQKIQQISKEQKTTVA
jgi:hypothetical protein